MSIEELREFIENRTELYESHYGGDCVYWHYDNDFLGIHSLDVLKLYEGKYICVFSWEDIPEDLNFLKDEFDSFEKSLKTNADHGAYLSTKDDVLRLENLIVWHCTAIEIYYKYK